MKVGVLALQGAFREHAEALDALGAEAVLVKTPEHLAGVDSLVLPGGESTTMSHLLATSGLDEALDDRLRAGMPVLGTCAGMILLAEEVLDGRPDQRALGAVDISVRRNAYGRQRESFETDLTIDGLAGTFPGVFIRAPAVERVGEGVTILAEVDRRAVMCRQGTVTVCAFHPELSGDLRVHAEFLKEAATR
ncbi:MAG: pyridoxal 5'-phosphate synthase glutaminase subunit PdxT [Actinobacteria bacterium]|nr:pyridoxal 5'-phosphate synthase glutaminase subunit PdxT [Actinomycetota bacterium]